MSLARVKVWNPGDVLTANDLNAEFNNILNNPGSLISPLTGNLDLGNFQLVRARLENVTTTQSAAQVGRAMFNSSANTIDIDTGSFIYHVPGAKSSQVNSTGGISVSDGALPKAWVVFNGLTSAPSISAAYGVSTSVASSGVSWNSTGSYNVTFFDQFSVGTQVAYFCQAGGTTSNAYTNITAVSTSGLTFAVVAASGLIGGSVISVVAYGVQV